MGLKTEGGGRERLKGREEGQQISMVEIVDALGC